MKQDTERTGEGGRGGGVLNGGLGRVPLLWSLKLPLHIQKEKEIVQTGNNLFSHLVTNVRKCLPRSEKDPETYLESLSPFSSNKKDFWLPSHSNTISQTC